VRRWLDEPTMSRTFLEPQVIDSGTGSGRWMVVMYNNDTNTMEEVIEVLMRSTGCSTDEAYIEMWEAHTFGRANVHFAKLDECEIVAAMISSIGVRTEVRREWEDLVEA
jgi:ATP-dependent Clp protease adapter protein ClpS